MNGRILGLCVLAAGTAVAAARASSLDVHLVEPAEHAALAAGSTATIGWETPDAPGDVDEWEAFVSVDGGVTYPIRITPHLDVRIRRFAWTVPFVPGSELSILLRFGNEQEERLFSFPRRTIVRGTVPLEIDRLRRAGIERNGSRDHGLSLVEWVDGTREGANLRRMLFDPSSLSGNAVWSDGGDGHENQAIRDLSERTVRTPSGTTDRPAKNRPRRTSPQHAERTDVLTLTHRLNT